jgi:hypothetical protein
MGVGNPGSRIGAFALALLATAALCVAAVVGDASGALVGKNGRVYACYKAKGKHKGAVRLVAKNAHCRKGEKKVSWSVTGPSGENGSNGENGTGGEGGAGGEKGTTGTQGLEKQVQQLTNKVTSLESVLKGITNTELLGALSKLQGISGTQLQETVASLADAKALCAQATVLTNRANEFTGAFGGFSLNSALTLLGGVLNTPTLAAPLSSFACP